MSDLYVAAGEIKGGKFLMSMHAKTQLHDAVRGWKDGPVTLKLAPTRAQRSLDQNAYMHAVVFPMLAREIGDSVEGVKRDCMGEKWGWVDSKIKGYPIPLLTTSQMSVEQCSEFIEWVIPWAMNFHGVSIPLPHEADLDAPGYGAGV